LADRSSEAQERARANADKKFLKAQAIDQAMDEYSAAAEAQRKKSAKLKALRLAKEADEAAAQQMVADEKAAKPAPRKRKAKAAT
jgi:hypothetical protein